MLATGRKFQLDDQDDADEAPLTHMGTSLADLDFSSQVGTHSSGQLLELQGCGPGLVFKLLVLAALLNATC